LGPWGKKKKKNRGGPENKCERGEPKIENFKSPKRLGDEGESGGYGKRRQKTWGGKSVTKEASKRSMLMYQGNNREKISRRLTRTENNRDGSRKTGARESGADSLQGKKKTTQMRGREDSWKI